LKTILILGAAQPVAKLVAAQLQGQDQYNLRLWSTGDPHKAAAYMDAVKNADIIYSDFTGMDVDWNIEAVTEAMRQQENNSARFIFRSVSGIDGELTNSAQYTGIQDKEKFLDQQRYAIKMIDEAEIPYTILRVGNVIDGPKTDFTIYNEGNQIPFGNVSCETLATIVVDEISNAAHVNQSIGIIEK